MILLKTNKPSLANAAAREWEMGESLWDLWIH